MAEYGRSKIDWFQEFLILPNGIPSHDTFGRLFAKINPKGFHDFFTQWVQELSESLKGKTVAIDGKKLRGSHDRVKGKSAIHMVSAWASELCLVLGQLKTDDKSNEITAIFFCREKRGDGSIFYRDRNLCICIHSACFNAEAQRTRSTAEKTLCEPLR